jgi:hypothetical protein
MKNEGGGKVGKGRKERQKGRKKQKTLRNSVSDPDPEPGRPKLPPPPKKKGKKEYISCFNSLNVFCGGSKKTYTQVFGATKFLNCDFNNFVIKNLGLDPNPDWIRIQQQPGSGSGFSKIPGSGSGSGFTGSGPENLLKRIGRQRVEGGNG